VFVDGFLLYENELYVRVYYMRAPMELYVLNYTVVQKCQCFNIN